MSCLLDISVIRLYRNTYFTHIAASITVTDDVTNQVTHKIFNTNLLYNSNVSLKLKTDEKYLPYSGGLIYL